MNIQDIVAANVKKLAKSKEEYDKHLQEYRFVQLEINKLFSVILHKFKDFKNNEIRVEHNKNCNCRPRYYNFACFTDNGITLTKDANHPNDIVDDEFSWDEVNDFCKNSNLEIL